MQTAGTGGADTSTPNASDAIFVFVGSWLAVAAWQDGRLAPPWRTHIGLLLIGWWDWAPFALMAGGGLLILAGAVGALARS